MNKKKLSKSRKKMYKKSITFFKKQNRKFIFNEKNFNIITQFIKFRFL